MIKNHILKSSNLNWIFGAVINEALTDEVIVTVIATGFDKNTKKVPEPAYNPMPSQQPTRRMPSREEYSYQPEVLADDDSTSGSGNDDLELPVFLRDRNF